MSTVLSELYKNTTVGHSSDEFGEDFPYSIEDVLKAYGSDDKFYLELKHYSMYHTHNSIVLDVSDAKRLKKQLEEFIKLNS